MKVLVIAPLILLMSACQIYNEKAVDSSLTGLGQEFQRLEQARTEAEIGDDLRRFMDYYDENVICMAEYQPVIFGAEGSGQFYEEIFSRQDVKQLVRRVEEIIDFDSTVIELGTFDKEYVDHTVADTRMVQHGKYWNVWRKSAGGWKIVGEAFGFNHHVPAPERLVTEVKSGTSLEAMRQASASFLELRAYNALMEDGVRRRDGVTRAGFFTDDAVCMPFAEPTVRGMDEIRPYLIEYSARGHITVDSIDVYTIAYQQLEGHVLEYDGFKVKWWSGDYLGRTEGKGIRLWKRQSDHSLKLYREIGTHNYLY